MSALEVLVGVAGSAVTILVVAAMILITPRGQVDLRERADDPQGSSLSRAPAPDSAHVYADGAARDGGEAVAVGDGFRRAPA